MFRINVRMLCLFSVARSRHMWVLVRTVRRSLLWQNGTRRQLSRQGILSRNDLLLCNIPMLILLDQVLRVETDPNGETRIVRLHDDWVNTEITSGKFVP